MSHNSLRHLIHLSIQAFYIVHWIINEPQKYIRSLTRQYLKRDQELHRQKELAAMRPLIMQPSDEVYIYKYSITIHSPLAPPTRKGRQLRCRSTIIYPNPPLLLEITLHLYSNYRLCQIIFSGRDR